MKRLIVFLITLAIAVTPTIIAQEEADLQQLLQDFARSDINPGGLNLTVIHLNDATVEQFFSAPTKYSLRVQAKQTTIFWVTGRAEAATEIDDEWLVRQGSREIQAETVNISNFEPGSQLAEGDEFSGLLRLDELVNPRAEFRVSHQAGDYLFDFAFSTNAVSTILGP